MQLVLEVTDSGSERAQADRRRLELMHFDARMGLFLGVAGPPWLTWCRHGPQPDHRQRRVGMGDRPPGRAQVVDLSKETLPHNPRKRGDRLRGFGDREPSLEKKGGIAGGNPGMRVFLLSHCLSLSLPMKLERKTNRAAGDASGPHGEIWAVYGDSGG